MDRILEVFEMKFMKLYHLLFSFEGSFHIPFETFFFEIVTFVIELFPFNNSNLHFSKVFIVEIDAERYKGKSLFLDRFKHLVNLFFVEEKFTASTLFMAVKMVRCIEYADMDIKNKRFASDDFDKAVFEVDTCRTECFDF